MDDENVVVDNSNTTQEGTPEVQEETIEQVKARLEEETSKRTKAEEIAENQRIRAEKAERKAKEPPAAEPQGDGLSTKDVLYLAKADIHEDDVADVLEWARFKKIPVTEAHKQLKGTLAVRAEERKSAEVANVSNVRRGPSKVTDEVLLQRVQKGELPESDDEIERLIAAKLKKK